MIRVKEAIETITSERDGKPGIGSGQYKTLEFPTKKEAKEYAYDQLRRLMMNPAGFKANIKITESGVEATKRLGTSYRWEFVVSPDQQMEDSEAGEQGA